MKKNEFFEEKLKKKKF